MKLIFLFIFSSFIIIDICICQERDNTGGRILLQGLVLDAGTLTPISNSQIMINRAFSTVTGEDGKFAFYVYRYDSVIFRSLGYKPTLLYINDTLAAGEFVAGIYLNSDTLSIGEVIIVPRLANLKSEIMNAGRKTPSIFDNARYNVAVSAYQGRNSQSTLGTPADNYALLSQKQKEDASSKGGIPSDKMLAISPFLLIPAAYLLIHGLPEKAPTLKPQLTEREVDEIQKKYFEVLRQRK
jgi:hypothetical protein